MQRAFSQPCPDSLFLGFRLARSQWQPSILATLTTLLVLAVFLVSRRSRCVVFAGLRAKFAGQLCPTILQKVRRRQSDSPPSRSPPQPASGSSWIHQTQHPYAPHRRSQLQSIHLHPNTILAFRSWMRSHGWRSLEGKRNGSRVWVGWQTVSVRKAKTMA